MMLAASFRRHSAQFVLILLIAVAGTARLQGQVYGDQQLIQLARDTYERAKGGNESDWMYAAIHINALIQRNPLAVRNDAAFAKELADGLAFAAGRLTAWYQAFSQRPSQPAVAQGGVVGTRAGLGISAPNIKWPQ